MSADQPTSQDPTWHGSLGYWQTQYETADLERRTAAETNPTSGHGQAAYQQAVRELARFGWPIGYDRERADHDKLSQRVHVGLEQKNTVPKHLATPENHAYFARITSPARQAAIRQRAQHAQDRAAARARRGLDRNGPRGRVSVSADQPFTPEEGLIATVVSNVTGLLHPDQPDLADRRADVAVAAWRQHGSHGLASDHPHRGLFHAVGHAAERRASLGDRVYEAHEAENRRGFSGARQVVVRDRANQALLLAFTRAFREEVAERDR